MTSISKTQVDKLGDRLRKGKLEEGDSRLLDSYRRMFAGAYEEVVGIVRGATNMEPTGRTAKSTTSITEKLRREKIRLTQMQDIAGCRLVVPDVAAQNQVVDRLMSALPLAHLVDRRKMPSFGYRAVHIVATARGRAVEIQVRTELQHLWAQLSEKLSDAFGPAIKYGGGNSQTQEYLSAASAAISTYEEPELMLSRLAQPEDIQLQSRTAKLTEELNRNKRDLRDLLEEAITIWGTSPGSLGGN